MSKEQPELHFYHDVDDDAVGFTSRMLNAAGGQAIAVRISSPGGFAFPGAAVFNLLAAYPGRKTAYIDGIAAGTAALIAMAANRVIAPENTYMLIDEPAGLVIGPAAQHREMAADLEKIASVNAGIFSRRSGRSIDACRAMMQRGALMTAAEAKNAGLVDEIAPVAALVAAFDLGQLPPAAGLFKAAVGRVDPTGVARSRSGAGASGDVSRLASRQGRTRIHDPNRPVDPAVQADWKAANERARALKGGG
jgi:ATP-dependent Clp protease, protease subunit